MKNQRGITLVALVITIIVLLILASVSIMLVLGEHGVLSRTLKAGEAQEKATAMEEIKLSLVDAGLAYYNACSTNPNIGKGQFFGNEQYFIENCSSAASTNGIELERASGVTDDSVTGLITVKYKVKSGVYYTFTFLLESPEKFESVIGPTKN